MITWTNNSKRIYCVIIYHLICFVKNFRQINTKHSLNFFVWLSINVLGTLVCVGTYWPHRCATMKFKFHCGTLPLTKFLNLSSNYCGEYLLIYGFKDFPNRVLTTNENLLEQQESNWWTFTKMMWRNNENRNLCQVSYQR